MRVVQLVYGVEVGLTTGMGFSWEGLLVCGVEAGVGVGADLIGVGVGLGVGAELIGVELSPSYQRH